MGYAQSHVRKMYIGACFKKRFLARPHYTRLLSHGISQRFFSPTAKLAMGSLAQNSSGAIRCSCNTRFRRMFRRVPAGSGANG